MMILFGYFLIAALIGVAASAVIGYFLASLIDRRFLKN
jgi:ABC-type microcin C transport system permease subunit YejE